MDIPVHLRLAPKMDNQPIIKLTFISTSAPTYRVIHCVDCGKSLGSVEGGRVYDAADVDDVSWDPDKPRLNIRCNGPYCRTYYRFTLNPLN